MLAISTIWNYNTSSNTKQMLSKIKETGICAIEVSCNFSTESLEELFLLVNDLGIKVVSVHNFCPLPAKLRPNRYASDYYRLSSLDQEEHRRAIEYTKRTIDIAVRLRAEAIVIHADTVELDNKYIKMLMRLYCEGNSHSKQYAALKDEILKLRKIKEKPHLDLAIKSLEQIMPYAYAAKIKIALENRYYPNEIPNLKEAERFLGLFAAKGMVYWHDSGHAEVQERLGIVSHGNFLKRLSRYLFGFHIHDLRGIDDHLAPFTGDFDFSKLGPYFRNDLFKVIEVHQPATSSEIKEAILRLSG